MCECCRGLNRHQISALKSHRLTFCSLVSPLSWRPCLKFASVDAVTALLECGANPNVRNRMGASTPLHMLTQSRKATPAVTLQVAEILLRYGADPSLADNRGSLPVDYLDDTDKTDPSNQALLEKLAPRPPNLFAAIQENNLQKVKELLSPGGDSRNETSSNSLVNETHRGQTPLLVAVEQLMQVTESFTENDRLDTEIETDLDSRVSIIQILLQTGADPNFNSQNILGPTNEDSNMVSQLLDVLLRVGKGQQKHEEDGTTAIVSVAERYLQDTIVLLLQTGVQTTTNLEPFLQQAARFNVLSMVQFLLQRAAPLLLVTREGGSSSLDVNARGRQGLTALHFCARSGQMAVLRYLLSLPDIDITVKDDRGMTALDAARVNNKEAVVQALEAFQASKNESDEP